MELILQKELPHQQKAVDAVCKVFDDVYMSPPTQFFENPRINLDSKRLITNIREIQSALPVEYRSNLPIGECLNLDIKMETGTGKTYVYTKIMYELHKCYGWNKFIIVVPSLTIKAGTAQFLQEDYVRQHFKDSCGYDTDIELGVVEAPKNKKKGRSFFPGEVSDFVRGSCQNANKIYVLLMNMQLLTGAKMLSRDDYDYGVEGFNRPFDAICATRPIVILDEPHRFSRGQKAMKVIAEEIRPQCLIRFGATFPEITTGSGKNRIAVKDYRNLLYDLNACEAFNQNLIKGVAKEHLEPVSRKEEKVKILSIVSKDSVSLQYRKKERDSSISKTYSLKVGESLSVISNAFEGITIDAIGTSAVEFSNGITKTTGEELDVDIYMTSYQEQMLRLALERHFQTERENFTGRQYKIKTLALFFIDDITSYRPDPKGKKPYLLEAFERLLKESIEKTMMKLNDHEFEYQEYLKASLADISACHAGYFSQDNSDSDENIAQEVDVILHGKKQLLSFKNSDGSYNTLRFLFSKWTLKEGWDNPNVFTIAKLRSSGSENSKLQEVGRGLRLPVDENGNRISNEEFLLNYIVDFGEADFAEKLVKQINGEIPQADKITELRLASVAKKLGLTSDDLFDELYCKHYIDRHMKIRAESRDLFFEEYPDFVIGLMSGKVKNRNIDKAKPIKIRKASFDEIQELWQKLNQRYLLFYDKNLDDDMELIVETLLGKPGVFTDMVMVSERETIDSDGSQMNVIRENGVQYIVSKPVPYHDFLKRITRTTNIPISVLHKGMCAFAKKHGTVDPRLINENSAAAFSAEFHAWKNENLQGRFRYSRSENGIGATALTYADGSPRDEIAQGRIGTKIMSMIPSNKYLYDTAAYDSPLEKDNIEYEVEDVVVYGKIPRSSIAIPTITGGMYSPDFMYIVRRSDGTKEINIVIETKDVENKSELRGTEKAKIDCAKAFFDMLSQDGYTVYFRDQLNNKQMAQIIDEVLIGEERTEAI